MFVICANMKEQDTVFSRSQLVFKNASETAGLSYYWWQGVVKVGLIVMAWSSTLLGEVITHAIWPCHSDMDNRVRYVTCPTFWYVVAHIVDKLVETASWCNIVSNLSRIIHAKWSSFCVDGHTRICIITIVLHSKIVASHVKKKVKVLVIEPLMPPHERAMCISDMAYWSSPHHYCTATNSKTQSKSTR